MIIRLTFAYTGELGTATVTWYRDGAVLADGSYSGGVTVTGATTTTLTIDSPTLDWEGDYYATVTDGADCVATSDVFSLDLCDVAITTQPATQEINRDETLNLTVTATGTGILSYQWYLDGAPLSDGPSGDTTVSGATTANLTLTNIQHDFAGSYTVVVTDSAIAGCEITSDPADITVLAPLGPGFVPAYSSTSDIVLGGFEEYPGGSGGPILTRRIPEDAALQTLNLGLTGGAAYYPAGNKFYHGALQTGITDGFVRVIDPVADTFTPIYCPGEDANSGGRCFYYASIGEIWVAADGGNMWLRIDPTDNSIIGYILGATISDFDWCSTNDCIYATDSGNVYKIDSAGTVTTVFQASTIGVGYSIGSIIYITSLDIVCFLVYNSGAAYFLAWQIDPATDTASPYSIGAGGSVMYYSIPFDRIVLQTTSDGTPSGLPVTLGSFTTAFVFVKALHYTGTGDSATAKGVYCSSISKEAIPVLQGNPGDRFYDLGFYGSADLT